MWDNEWEVTKFFSNNGSLSKRVYFILSEWRVLVSSLSHIFVVGASFFFQCMISNFFAMMRLQERKHCWKLFSFSTSSDTPRIIVSGFSSNCMWSISDIKLRILNQKILILRHRAKLWSSMSSAARHLSHIGDNSGYIPCNLSLE